MLPPLPVVGRVHGSDAHPSPDGMKRALAAIVPPPTNTCRLDRTEPTEEQQQVPGSYALIPQVPKGSALLTKDRTPSRRTWHRSDIEVGVQMRQISRGDGLGWLAPLATETDYHRPEIKAITMDRVIAGRRVLVGNR